MERFTLVEGRWYAAELIGDEFIDDSRGRTPHSYSPIRVDTVRRLETGRGEMVLEFFHANYPQGVQDKSYHLRVLERQSRFLLARSLGHSPTRLLLIYEVTWAWLERHFGLKPDQPGIDLQKFMEERLLPLDSRVCGVPPTTGAKADERAPVASIALAAERFSNALRRATPRREPRKNLLGGA